MMTQGRIKNQIGWVKIYHNSSKELYKHFAGMKSVTGGERFGGHFLLSLGLQFKNFDRALAAGEQPRV